MHEALSRLVKGDSLTNKVKFGATQLLERIESWRGLAASCPFPLGSESSTDEKEIPAGRKTRAKSSAPASKIGGMISRIVSETGLFLRLEQSSSEKARDAADNIRELIASVPGMESRIRGNLAAEFPEADSVPLMEAIRVYIESISLLSDADTTDEGAGMVSLMTLHSAKGLEFPVVFLCGLEERLFPHIRTMESSHGVEEERRLFYVGLTRAKDRCYLSYAMNRRFGGYNQPMQRSRFIREIPSELLAFEETRPASVPQGRPSPSRPLRGGDRPVVVEERVSSGSQGSPFDPGDSVSHRTFGVGKVTRIEPAGTTHKVWVSFERFGEKLFLQRHARLKRV